MSPFAPRKYVLSRSEQLTTARLFLNAPGFLFAALLAIAASTTAQAQSYRDAFDVSRGTVVTKSSSTPKEFDPSGMLGADTPGEKGAGVTIFDQGGLDFIEFATRKAVTIEGVTLYVGPDNDREDSPRAVAEFNLLADCDGDGSFERPLVEHAKPANNWSANVFRFPPVTAASFRAEFQAAFKGPEHLAGPRIVELDAIGDDEPFNWVWGAAASAAVLAGAGVCFYVHSNKKALPVQPAGDVAVAE